MNVKSSSKDNKIFFRRMMEQREFGVFCALILIVVLLSFLTDNFLSTSNLLNVLRSVSINGIIACGMTFVILTGGIDLSVGSIVAISGVVAAGVFNGTKSSLIAALVCLGIGILLGLFNGVMIAYGKVPAFIQTLVTMTAARGATYLYSQGLPISGVGGFIEGVGRGYTLNIPNPVLLTAIVFIICWYLLNETIIGRYTYAIGGNEECTKLSGVRVKLYKMLSYVISGICASLGAIILIGRLNSGQPSMGDSYEMDAIAAVVIGGTSLSGGSGTVLGTLIGALIIGVLLNGMNMLGLDSYMQYIVKGIVILFAVLLEIRREK